MMNHFLLGATTRWKRLASVMVASTCLVSVVFFRCLVTEIRRQGIAQDVLFSRGCFCSTYLSLGKTSPDVPRLISAVIPAQWIPANHVIYESYCEGRSGSEFEDLVKAIPSGVRIRMMSLDGSAVDDSDIELLLHKCSRRDLEELRLRDCRLLKDRAVELLSSCPNLSRIGLSGTSITDRSLDILSTMSVSELSVANTSVTCERAVKFKMSSPHSRVDSDSCDR